LVIVILDIDISSGYRGAAALIGHVTGKAYGFSRLSGGAIHNKNKNDRKKTTSGGF
jgi:hypothetical protein